MDKIKQAISNFKRNASPSNASLSGEVTAADIRKLIDEIAKLANVIAQEIDRKPVN